MAWGCVDCLSNQCDDWHENCKETKYHAPCFKNPELPGCPDMSTGQNRRCG